jgi:hypothetical protein
VAKSEAKVREKQEKEKHLSATAWETPFSGYKTATTETIEPEDACLASGVLINDTELG